MDLSETMVLSGGNEGLVVSIVSGLALATYDRAVWRYDTLGAQTAWY